MAEGVNDFLNKFFLASGTFRHLSHLPDGSFLKASFRGWVGSYNICLAFLFSAALYILDRCFTNQLVNCVDNTSQLYFILGTDIAIPCDYVKRCNALY